jgi:hypothetical protein
MEQLYLKEGIASQHESSTIAQSIYYPVQELLTIHFKKGGQYTYHPVPQNIYAELILAESIGKTFQQLIRSNKDITFLPGPASEFPL